VKLSGQPLAPDAIQPQPVNPEIIACLVANHVDTEWELENIVVAEKSRRQGMGSRLLQAFVEHVRQSNGSFIFLEVRESNHAARALYEGFSFEITGRRKAYYPDPLEDAILYRWIVRKIS
jgi:ribosomal-protein-alanine N-acetyltransferase